MRVTCYSEHFSVTGWQLTKIFVFGWARLRSRCPTLSGRMRVDVETVCVFGGLFAHRSWEGAPGVAHSREECGNFSGTQVECGKEKGIRNTEYRIRKAEDGRRETEMGATRE